MATRHPPKRFQPHLWSADVNKLDIDHDKGYIINQLLIYSDLKDLQWLFKTYGRDTITREFVDHPSKQYPQSVYRFVKNYVLPLKNVELDEDDYVTSISGPVRQRASDRIL